MVPFIFIDEYGRTCEKKYFRFQNPPCWLNNLNQAKKSFPWKFSFFSKMSSVTFVVVCNHFFNLLTSCPNVISSGVINIDYLHKV